MGAAAQNETRSEEFGPLDMSEREKGGVIVNLVPSFERLTRFGCIFLGVLSRVDDCGGHVLMWL
jgi:hypothetical protein